MNKRGIKIFNFILLGANVLALLYVAYIFSKDNIEYIGKSHDIFYTNSLPLDGVVVVDFGYPVNKKEVQNSLKLTPDIFKKFKWESEYGLEGYGNKLLIYPDDLWDYGRNYVIEIPKSEGFGGVMVGGKRIEFKTVNLPRIIYIDTIEEIDIDQDVRIMVRGMNGQFEMKFSLSQDIPFSSEYLGEGEYVLKFDQVLSQGQEIDLKIETVYRDSTVLANQTYKIKTMPGLGVVFQDPANGRTNFPKYGEIMFEYNRPVNEESFKERFKIVDQFSEEKKEIEGEVRIEENKVFFKPKEEWSSEASYEVVIEKGVLSRDDSGYTVDDMVFGFRARPSNSRPIPDPKKQPIVTEGKLIDIDLSQQTLFAYEDGRLINSFLVSTGLPAFPTIPGSYTITQKQPVKHYRGFYGEGSPHNFDLPGVKWNMRIGNSPRLIHGAYWHNNFGRVMSHGCVNLSISDAEWTYHWSEIGTPIEIYY